MDESAERLAFDQYCELERLYLKPQKVPESISFWMIRSKRGVFYEEYLKSSCIAIGWNALLKQDFSVDSEGQRKDKIAKNYTSESRPGGCVLKCHRFIFEMKPGDIVVVVGSGRAAFCIVGEYFEENIENPIIKELEANAQIESQNFKEFSVPCPYQKRRHIRLIREVSEDIINPVLAKVISNRHSLSTLDEYATEVLSECFDFFEYNNKTHLVFRVTTTGKIHAKSLSWFLVLTTELLSSKHDLEISTKANLNSPGNIQFIIDSVQFVKENPLIITLIMTFIFGGDIEINGIKIPVPSLRSILKEQREKKHNKFMQEQEEKQAQANVRKTNAESAKLEADTLVALSKINDNIIFENPKIQEMYKNAVSSLKIEQPNLLTIEFPNTEENAVLTKKEHMDESDEKKI